MLKAKKRLLWKPDANLDLRPLFTTYRKKNAIIEIKKLNYDSHPCLLSLKCLPNTGMFNKLQLLSLSFQ